MKKMICKRMTSNVISWPRGRFLVSGATFAFGLSLGVAVGVAFAVGSLAAQDEPPPTRNDPPPSREQQREEKERLIEEIRNLRKRLGGGVTESLRDMDLGNPLEKRRGRSDRSVDPDSMFDAQLDGLADEGVRPPVGGVPVPRGGPTPIVGGTEGMDGAARGGLPFGPIQVPPSRFPGGREGVFRRGRDRLDAGRDASPEPLAPWQRLVYSAQLLDQAAGELEMVGEFQLASEIHEKAEQIRANARRLYQSGRPAGGASDARENGGDEGNRGGSP